MILCITPNIALDRTLTLPSLQVGEVVRPSTVHLAAGGKGVNVARAAAILGSDALVMGLQGGHNGTIVSELIAAEGLAAQLTPAQHETRICTILISEDGQSSTGIYERGEPIADTDWQKFVDEVALFAQKASVVAISGSLPVATPKMGMAKLIHAARASDTPVWVDSSGSALEQAVAARPTGIKINLEELETFVGRELPSMADVSEVANALLATEINEVVVTFGKNGAMWASQNETITLPAPAIDVVSAVGSGDSFFAGLLAGIVNGDDKRVALSSAIACGAANAMSAGGAQFSKTIYQRLLEMGVGKSAAE